jgi:IS30 family transposase
MGYVTGFRGRGVPAGGKLPESVRESFWEAVRSGLTPTAAATIAGVSGDTGRQWARDAGYRSSPQQRGHKYSKSVRESFWAAMASGATPLEAAVTAGVSGHTGRCWVDQAGYVPRTAAPPVDLELVTFVSGSMLFIERCRLEELLESGRTQARAAVVLGRDRSTISREAGRGATVHGYRASVGQNAADAGSRRPKPRKLEANAVLLAEVLRRLKQRHSPEQIAGRLREEFPDDPEMWVSHETIYQAIYVQPRGELAQLVKTALRTGRTQRKPRGRAPSDGGAGRLRDMINISERPAEADDRAIPGHWESQWCCQAA